MIDGVARDAVALELVVEVLRRGHAQSIVARGGSMTPAIVDGARLTLAPLTPAARRAHPLALGDVVAVATPRVGLVVHRVVGVDSAGRVLVKGDANPSPDGWFERAALVARVVDVDGGPVSPPLPFPPRWRRGFRRLRALITRYTR